MTANQALPLAEAERKFRDADANWKAYSSDYASMVFGDESSKLVSDLYDAYRNLLAARKSANV